ncbi:hypothetical protein IU470_16475 [Nocardia abscessus]|uniref:Uncharacterized protein n=2 Tax=Nocardia abscessus TaxID=120957 RepID=A0ABS0CA35_9NOCA|nr:hypothetical protein [Nocardia abscessus]
MTDRWARAEELFRQREADRRYRRDDQAWGEHDYYHPTDHGHEREIGPRVDKLRRIVRG